MASEIRKTYYYTDKDGNEKSVRINGKSAKELDKKFQLFLSNPQSATFVPTVIEFVEQVYKPTYFPTLRPKTVDNYDQYLNLNIYPFLGGMRMDEVKVTTIQDFYNWMATASQRGRKKDLNGMTITRVSGFTSRIFRVALEMKIIADTPFKKTLLRVNAEKAGHHKALPDAEIARIKQAIPSLENEDERLYMALIAYTGMRLEEALGLKWEDFSFRQRYCSIKRAVTHPQNSKYYIGETKTEDSQRTVLLPQPLVNILKPLDKKRGFVLGGEEPWCYSKKQRVFANAKKHLSIEGYSNHDFRTTFCTQLREAGLTSIECAGLLGHADTRMVETIYARTRHEGNMKHLSILEKMNAQESMALGKTHTTSAIAL